MKAKSLTLVYVVFAVAALLAATMHWSAPDAAAMTASKVSEGSCAPPPFGDTAPAAVLIATRRIAKGTRGAVILYQQLYVGATVPCKERSEDPIVDPAYLKGRVARQEIVPGQQLTRSQFSDPARGRAVPARAACRPGSEWTPAPVLLVRKLIRKGTRGSEALRKRLFEPGTIPCWERWKGVIVDPTYVRGRVATRDLFPAQQLTRSALARS